MILSFSLSMPNVASWDGQWSGEGRNYVKAVDLGQSHANEQKANEILDTGYFYYAFGDGWSAGVTVKEVDSQEAATIRRKSDGFYGYDWMIDSIIREQKIVT